MVTISPFLRSISSSEAKFVLLTIVPCKEPRSRIWTYCSETSAVTRDRGFQENSHFSARYKKKFSVLSRDDGTVKEGVVGPWIPSLSVTLGRTANRHYHRPRSKVKLPFFEVGFGVTPFYTGKGDSHWKEGFFSVSFLALCPD